MKKLILILLFSIPALSNETVTVVDKDGNATGYAVPNSNGGANIYDLDGNRNGYYR